MQQILSPMINRGIATHKIHKRIHNELGIGCTYRWMDGGQLKHLLNAPRINYIKGGAYTP